MADKNEPPIKQEDFFAFLKSYAPPRGDSGERDMLGGRYRILTAQPLAEFSTSYASAYAARDEKMPEASVYALVYENGAPLRHKNIEALKNFRHDHCVSLLADGQAEISAKNQLRYVVILEKPQGQTLAQLLARRGSPLPASLIIEQYLRPLSEIIAAFARMGISHNRINPSTVFVQGGKAVLGECVSEPSGFSQAFLSEPIERMLCLPRGKADFAPSADCYALAILALELALGFIPFAQITQETLMTEIVSQGAYQTLVMPWDLPAELQDLFRGLLGDAKRERWDAQHIESWLAGRRFNLILPGTAKEAMRGFDFEHTLYYNRRSLAYGIRQHWQEARALLSDGNLLRWLTIHVHRAETADAIKRLTQGNAARTAAQENELIARIVTLLDPTGPLRLGRISTGIESIGALLAHAVAAERNEDIDTLIRMVEADLPAFWIEQQKAAPEYTAFSAKMAKARQHLRMKGLGFGLERFLYDLNPGLPCLSPMIADHPAATPKDVLIALDGIAAKNAGSDMIGDKHIAAFLASRLDIGKEIKLGELGSLPLLRNHPTLIMLKLLSQAERQAKAGELSLKGLTHWLAARLLPLFGTIHSQARRLALQRNLQKATVKGSLKALAELMLSKDSFEADQREFRRASADYALRNRHIAALKSTEGLAYVAAVKGRGVSQCLAYGVCLATVYFTLKSYYHL